jgi:hypothetical protein
LFAFALFEVFTGNPKLPYRNCESFSMFCHPFGNAFLTPYTLMAGSPVHSVERLAFERESENVENEPRIMSATPQPKPAPRLAALIPITLPAI